MGRLRALLVDDNPQFLEVAARFLTSHSDIEVVGIAGSGREALLKVHDLNPEVVVMDLSMPEMNGLEATRQIKALPEAPCVVILTLYEGVEIPAFAEEAGADQFVTKSDFGDRLLPELSRLFPKLHVHNTNECV